MSMKFTAYRQFTTAGNLTSLSGATTGSVAYFFRYDGSAAAVSTWPYLTDLFQGPLNFDFNGNPAAGTIGMTWNLRNATFQTTDLHATISTGTVYHVAL